PGRVMSHARPSVTVSGPGVNGFLARRAALPGAPARRDDSVPCRQESHVALRPGRAPHVDQSLVTVWFVKLEALTQRTLPPGWMSATGGGKLRPVAPICTPTESAPAASPCTVPVMPML